MGNGCADQHETTTTERYNQCCTPKPAPPTNRLTRDHVISIHHVTSTPSISYWRDGKSTLLVGSLSKAPNTYEFVARLVKNAVLTLAAHRTRTCPAD